MLGADDKARIAEILTAMEFIISNPRIKHGKIRVAYTGRGDQERNQTFQHRRIRSRLRVHSRWGGIGELQYETFNANTEVVIKGLNIHPGEARKIG